jgi:hypothetical protein
MKLFYIVSAIFALACGKSRKAQKPTDMAMALKDSGIIVNTDTPKIKLPKGIEQLIEKLKAEEIVAPPRELWEYTLIDKKVYYVPAPQCCDFFSDLYNEAGELIAHPDGGFTGRGDNKMPNFATDRTNGRIVWVDKRKPQPIVDSSAKAPAKKLF